MSKRPRVSIVMPAYNAERYILSAIDSILTQSHIDLELIIINDGSTDMTSDLLRSVNDDRMLVYDKTVNGGLAAARNTGLEKSRGEFIAWLDADDVSEHHRIARQVHELDRNSELAVCGTWVRRLGTKLSQTWHYPKRSNFIQSRMLFDNPLATSSVMMRRDVFESGEVFNADFAPAEDYDMWQRLSKNWRITNIPRVLTSYRTHESQTSILNSQVQRQAVRRIQLRQLRSMGIEPSDDELQIHIRIGIEWGAEITKTELPQALDWLNKLKAVNSREKIFPSLSFDTVIHQRSVIAANACQKSLLRTAKIKLLSALS